MAVGAADLAVGAVDVAVDAHVHVHAHEHVHVHHLLAEEEHRRVVIDGRLVVVAVQLRPVRLMCMFMCMCMCMW